MAGTRCYVWLRSSRGRYHVYARQAIWHSNNVSGVGFHLNNDVFLVARCNKRGRTSRASYPDSPDRYAIRYDFVHSVRGDVFPSLFLGVL